MFMKKLLNQALAIISLSIFTLIALQSTAFAGNCGNPRYAAKNPEECGGDPPGEPTTLQVTVRYGDQDDEDDDEAFDNCPSATCIETMFTAVGSVICNSQTCDFTGEVIDGPYFGIAPSVFNLLALTSIRNTQLEPELCYAIPGGIPINPPDGSNGESYTEAGMTKEPVINFWLRSPIIDPGNWWADVTAHSTDMAGDDQKYVFKFGGQCDRSAGFCPSLSGVDFDGVYENGFVPAIFGSGTNKRNQPQTCRCTVSSKPSCPEHVDMGSLLSPRAQIEIVELP
jgi:hypothetical protein